MANAIDLEQLIEQEGFKTEIEFLETFGMKSIVPAMCSEGCHVEPDGTCEHGNESFLLYMDLI